APEGHDLFVLLLSDAREPLRDGSFLVVCESVAVVPARCLFLADRLGKLMEFKWFKWEEGLPIEHPMVSKSIETAQRRVEGHNFDIRKQLLEYDNTMNRQREVIYEQRRRILEGVDLGGLVRDISEEVVDGLLDTFAANEQRPDAWDLTGLREAVGRQFAIILPEDVISGDRDTMQERLCEVFQRAYDAKREAVGPELMRRHEQTILLLVIDTKWKDHLYMMDALREGIHLRAYGQRDPLVEYQREAYRMFQDMIESIKVESLTMLLRIQPATEARAVGVFAATPHQELHLSAPTIVEAAVQRAQAEPAALGSSEFEQVTGPPSTVYGPQRQGVPVQRTGPKVGRNEPCHCGSGKKYKKCHGK
ncbi:MAG TPA: SEC-C metal-binding domain-containing protein, partial [archaeon]|nr:SEC-C metal-binding domain-containing protein [archaeon]